jgi:drug/metabolite transporter (DMT)-like permease
VRKEESPTSTGILKWLLPYVLVASFQYQFTKGALDYASPFIVMGTRYIIVGVVFYFIGGRKLPLDRNSLLLAAFTSISTILWAFGLRIVSPGDSAVLSYTMPLFSIPLAYFIIKDKIVARELIGALIGFSGVVLYSLALAHGSLLIGAVLTVLNAFFWAAYSVYYRKLKDREVAPLFATQFLVGSIPMIVGAFFLPTLAPTTNFFLDMIYVVVFTGLIQYYLWNGLLRRGRVGKITTMAFAVPATTLLIDSVETWSVPSYVSIMGAIVMFVGIYVANWREKTTITALNQAEKNVEKSGNI